MYLEFFQLSRKPFNSSPDPDSFYLTAAVRAALDRMADTIRQREPCLLLSGEPGTGKTALLKRLMMNDDLGVRWIFFNNAQLSWNELLLFIGRDLGLCEEALLPDQRAEAVTKKVLDLACLGLYPVLIIDEADHFSNTTLRQLLTWHAANQARGVPLTIIFSGLKGLAKNFNCAGQGLFSAHPSEHCELLRFDLQETRTVLDHRLNAAGYQGPELFEDEALQLVQRLSGGIPRVINLVCDLALVLAASIQKRKISAQIVQEASEYILLDKYPAAEKGSCAQGPPTDPEKNKPVGKDAAPVADQPVGAAASRPAARTSRQPSKWRWAAAGLLVLSAAAGTWLWLQSRPTTGKPESSRRMVFKVPPVPVAKRIKMPVPPSVPPARTVISEDSLPAPVARQTAVFQGPRDAAAPESASASPAAAANAGSKVRTDVPAEPEPARLTQVEEPPQARGLTLISAVENGDVEEVRRLLDTGADVDRANATGETALMKAAWAGRADMMALLLSYKPRINRQSLEGWTALFYAAVKGHKPVVTALLAAGAKPDIPDQDGRTPLMAAAWNGHADIAELLLDKSVNPNRKNREGWTPLMFAALEGHIDVAEILLRGGANPAVKNNEGDTSAQLAAHQGHAQFLSLLSTEGQL